MRHIITHCNELSIIALLFLHPHFLLFIFRFWNNSYHVYIDENGDAAGNYTILALKKDRRRDTKLSNDTYGLYPIGTFGLPDSHQIPVSFSNAPQFRFAQHNMNRTL